MAVDAPKSNNLVRWDALPKFFATWARVAWTDLLASLPEESDVDEIVDSAAEEFRRQVAACLYTNATFGERMEGDKTTQTERRSLLDWAIWFARKGDWAQTRSALLWCRVDGGQEGERRLQIAGEIQVAFVLADGTLKDWHVTPKAGRAVAVVSGGPRWSCLSEAIPSYCKRGLSGKFPMSCVLNGIRPP